MHFNFSHSIIISLFDEKKFNILLVPPGTIIEVIFPVSKSAHTSWTYPKPFSICYINNFLPSKIHSIILHICTPSKYYILKDKKCYINYIIFLCDLSHFFLILKPVLVIFQFLLQLPFVFSHQKTFLLLFLFLY